MKVISYRELLVTAQVPWPLQYAPPSDGWKSLKQAFETRDQVPQFNNGHIVSYFVTCSVIDGTDFMLINFSAENLFRCRHVQHTVKYAQPQHCCMFKLYAYLKWERVGCINCIWHSFDVVYASCSCAAGMGPNGSCKHIWQYSWSINALVWLVTPPKSKTPLCRQKIIGRSRFRVQKTKDPPLQCVKRERKRPRKKEAIKFPWPWCGGLHTNLKPSRRRGGGSLETSWC